MVHAIIAQLMFWGVRLGIAWWIADQYAHAVNEKLGLVLHALNGVH